MDIYKKMTVWELLMFLQKRVKINASSIRANNEVINGVDSNLKITTELLQTIKNLTQRNASLTSESSKFLNLFNALVELNKSYRHNLQGIFEDLKFDADEYNVKKAHFQDYLEKTIEGELELNKNHPYISDREFLNELLTAWRNAEKYEKCMLVKGILNTINN